MKRPASPGGIGQHTVFVGVLDAGLSSSASFACSLFAARTLDVDTLGAYALVFAAAQVSMITADTSTFAMLEVRAVKYPAALRPRLIPSTLRMGALPALVSALALSLCALFIPAAPGGAVLALTVTGVLYAFLSPVQDHVRRMLHICESSWLAAAVSTLHLVAVCGVIVLFVELHLPRAWGPFGALALGNIVSLLFGIIMTRRRAGGGAVRLPVRWREVFRAGRWLLLSGLAPNAAGLVASTLVGHLAGLATLGYTEVARIAGQPLIVLSGGLSTTIGPRLVAAVQHRRRTDARHASRAFLGIVFVAGALYLVLAGEWWPGNPMHWLVPKAFIIPGLVSLTIVANIVMAMAYPARSELLAVGNTRALAQVEWVGNGVRILMACAAQTIGALAVPAGLLILGATRCVGYRVIVHGRHRHPVRTGDIAATDTGAENVEHDTVHHKVFPPGLGQLRIPTRSKSDALRGLEMFPACGQGAVWAQRAACAGVKVFGPAILPGRSRPWTPVSDGIWSELLAMWQRRFGRVDAIAGYARLQRDRDGGGVLLLRDGKPTAFIKFLLQDPLPLENERAALDAVWRSRPRAFVVPEPLEHGSVDGVHYLAT